MEEDIYKKAKVVVVDDVEEVLNSTKNCLEFEGMQVKCFSNPLEGLDYLKKNKADVLLLDFYMPEMNGDEFVTKLREFNTETIIILQTGYSDRIPPLEMIDKMNIQGYLDKLKGEQELILMVKAAIKTAFLNKQILEKEKELSKIRYKDSITGSLIAHLVNDAKNQLLQISAMNNSIASETEQYEIQTRGINNAVLKIGKLYNALNFEYIDQINLNELKEIISILLKPSLIIANSVMTFEVTDDFIIEEKADDIIYLVVEAVNIFTKDTRNIINTKIEKVDNNIRITMEAKEIENKDFSSLKVLVDKANIEINGHYLIITK